MSGIVGSKFNHRGSGLISSLGTDGQHMLSSGAGKKHVFETVTAATTDLTPVRQDILTLGLRQAINENSNKYNLPNSAITHFEAAADYNAGGSTTIGLDTVLKGDFLFAGTSTTTLTTYTSGSGDYTVPANVEVLEVLAVAGGGGGSASSTGGQTGGGGGAGGIVYHTSLSSTPAATVAYAVGAGGAAGTTGSKDAAVGANTTFGSITALGGGGSNIGSGDTGGSGGGSGHSGDGASGTQGDSGGGTGYGNDGSNGTSNTASGAGGGAGGDAGATSTNTGAIGGVGRLFSNWTSYGVSGYFGGGGGGGGTTGGAGGSGGGGNGSGYAGAGTAGTANTGGGGGGASGNANGGAGGTGFLGIIAIGNTVNATGTALGTTNVPTSAVTEVSGVLLIKNSSGSNTLGTDVIVYFTADNSNFTEAASYTDSGTFSTGVKMIKLGKTTVTSGSDVRWKIVFANQSAGSKIGEIYGIGLNY